MISTPSTSNAQLQLEIIDDVDRWDALATQWNRLAGPHPFRRYEWLRGWWNGYGESRHLIIIRVSDCSGATRAIFPLHEFKGTAGLHTWALLGSGKACSDDLSFLQTPSEMADTVAVTADWLVRQAREGRWDVLELEGFGRSDRPMQKLFDRLNRAGLAQLSENDQSCWRTELGDGWEAFVATLSKGARRLVRNHAKRYDKHETTIAIAQSVDERDAFFDHIADFHQRRWQAAGVVGCFGAPQFERFLRDAVERMWDAGIARLCLARHQGRPIAGSIGMCLEGVHTLYLVGNDPDYARLQPGWALNVGVLRRACDDGLRAVDFVRGDEAYKARLGATPRRQIRTRFFSSSLRAKTSRHLAAIRLAVGGLAGAVRSREAIL